MVMGCGGYGLWVGVVFCGWECVLFICEVI